MSDDILNVPCRHRDSRVTCVQCLNDEVDAMALLARLEEEMDQ